MDEHFRVLGLQRGCQLAEVKTAYRAKALQLHPDRNPGGTEGFKRVQAAYEAITQHLKRVGGADSRTGPSAPSRTSTYAAGPAHQFARQANAPRPVPPQRTSCAAPDPHVTEELFGDVAHGIPGGWQFRFTTSSNSNTSSNAAETTQQQQQQAALHQRWTQLQHHLNTKLPHPEQSGVSYQEYRSTAERAREQRAAVAAAAAAQEAKLRQQREAEAAAAAAELEAWRRYMHDEDANAELERRRRTVRSETHRDALLQERRLLRRVLLQQRYVPEPADVQAMSDADVYTLLTMYRKLVPVLENLLQVRMTRTPCSRCGQVEKRASSGAAFVCRHPCVCGTCAQLATECPLCGAAREDVGVGRATPRPSDAAPVRSSAPSPSPCTHVDEHAPAPHPDAATTHTGVDRSCDPRQSVATEGEDDVAECSTHDAK